MRKNAKKKTKIRRKKTNKKNRDHLTVYVCVLYVLTGWLK